MQDVQSFAAGRLDKASQRDRDQALEGWGEQGAQRERQDNTAELDQDGIEKFRLLRLCLKPAGWVVEKGSSRLYPFE
ncbi:MAG TPA: hypothetical protein DHU81_18540 [Hyphomonas sp.]|nr:hypothetical protein [Hyphomonas sp.]